MSRNITKQDNIITIKVCIAIIVISLGGIMLHLSTGLSYRVLPGDLARGVHVPGSQTIQILHTSCV